jgi:hypothetical protein
MRSILVYSVIIAFSCASRKDEAKLNREAIVLHNSMMERAALIESKLVDLKDDSTVNQDSVGWLITFLNEWKGDVVEVPGNESESHDHHGHHHDHSLVNVTSEQMLEIQRELNDRLTILEERTGNLKVSDTIRETQR